MTKIERGMERGAGSEFKKAKVKAFAFVKATAGKMVKKEWFLDFQYHRKNHVIPTILRLRRRRGGNS